MAIYQIHKSQFITASIEQVWDFISDPRNLKDITPDYMGFEIISEDLPDRVYPGMIIVYRVRPLLGIPMKWVTEISQVEKERYFVDEQRIGPYAMWHHEHFIEPAPGGILMKDVVTYKPPLGFLGRLGNFLFIKRQLDGIFRYRQMALENKFSGS